MQSKLTAKARFPFKGFGANTRCSIVSSGRSPVTTTDLS